MLTALALLAIFALLGRQLIGRAEPVQVLKEITVAADPQGVILGRDELAHRPSAGRAAEPDHLLIRRAAAGWELGNVAYFKRVDAPTTRYRTRYLKRWRLQAGDQIRLHDAAVQVSALSDDRLELIESGGRRAVWEEGRLEFTEPAGAAGAVIQAPAGQCPAEGEAWWKRHLRWVRDIDLLLFSVGGAVNCPARWGLAGVPSRAVEVHWYEGAFWLAPGRGDAAVTLKRAHDSTARSFQELTLPLEGEDGTVLSVVVGRTQYRIQAGPERLHLIPLGGADVWRATEPPPEARDPGRVERVFETRTWIGGGAPLGTWLATHWPWALLALALAGGTVLGLLLRQRRTSRHLRLPLAMRLGAWPPALLFGVLTVGLGRAWGITDTGLLLGLCWLAWTWATLLLLASGRLRGLAGWLWCGALALTGSGVLALMQLAVGSDSTRWLVFAHKHLVLMTLAGWALLPVIAIPAEGLRRFYIALASAESSGWVVLRWLAPVALAVLLLVQRFAGGEHGLGGVQPVEAAKFLLVMMLAFVGLRLAELRRAGSREFYRAPLRFIAAALSATALFFIFAGAMMIAVNDISPVLILILLLLPLTWRMAPHPAQLSSPTAGWMRGGVLALVLIGIGALAWIYRQPAQMPDWLPQRDRLLVWADPLAHPHSGAQVLQALAHTAASPWLTSAWFGANQGIMTLPAVQDDFIGTFLIYRFGRAAALALLAAQLSFLGLLFVLAARLRRWGLAGDYRSRMTGEMLSLALYGLAWMLAAHWLIAWGNGLGLLPVMGQPMTWLSAATSHMAFFALPGLLLTLTTAWMLGAEDPR